ncbi:MAG: CRISPR-associated protein Cas4 [Chloroflexi bacterium]|nr:MAG: CRISPR-associated protein Cas4 [Chloroflexota bacterium]
MQPASPPAFDDETAGDVAGPQPIMISALEHYSYCPRQCALIHQESTFTDNIHTVRGRLVHERVDLPDHETRPRLHIERALPLWSHRLGLVGRADVVEFTEHGPYPVEYKVGKKRRWDHEAIQLGAQALCLEEMTGQPAPRGAVYYYGSRRRREIAIDAALRRQVEETVEAVRDMLASEQLPPPANDARCRECSLLDVCMPDLPERHIRRPSWWRALYDTSDPNIDR